MDHGLALVPRVTAAETVLLQDTVLPAHRRGKHSEGADHVPAGEQRWSAAHTGPAPPSAPPCIGQLDNVAQVEALVPVLALWLLGCLSSCNASCLASLQACKVVRVASAASVDELLTLSIVVVIPGGFEYQIPRRNIIWVIIPGLQGPARPAVHGESAWVGVLLPS